MLPTTLFPTIRIAKAVNFTVMRKSLSDRDRTTVSFNGQVIGSVIDYPHGAPSDVEVDPAQCEALVTAFLEKGYTDPHEHLVPAELRTKIYLQSICNALFQEESLLKTVKRQAKTQALWVCSDCKPGEYWKIKWPTFDENARQAIKVANPAQTVLFFVNDDIADL